MTTPRTPSVRTALPVSAAASIAVLGIVLGGVGIAWVAGSLGISAASASQIVAAVEAGGWALTLVAAMFGFGIGGAVVGTIRWYLSKKARNLAIA